MEVNYQRVKHSLIGAGGATKLYGEALILDLKGRGTVFILPVEHQKKTVLAQIYEFGIPLTFGVRRSIGVMVDEDFARLRQAKGRKPFSFALIDVPTRLPAFVAFRDEKMPKRLSTRLGYDTWLNNHILPRWAHSSVTDLQARPVELWLQSLALAPKRQGSCPWIAPRSVGLRNVAR